MATRAELEAVLKERKKTESFGSDVAVYTCDGSKEDCEKYLIGDGQATLLLCGVCTGTGNVGGLFPNVDGDAFGG